MERSCIVLTLAVGVAVAPLGRPGSEGCPTNWDLRGRVERAVAQIRAGDLSKGAALRQMGEEAIPILAEHAQDQDPNVRLSITMAVAENLDERAIPILVQGLLDAHSDVRRTAMDNLFRYPRELLRDRLSHEMLDILTGHAGSWEESSYKAVLLIGDLRGASKMSSLRSILREAKRVHGRWDIQTLLGPTTSNACLKALFKLGDEEAARAVLASLNQRDVSSVVFGIEALGYARKTEYLKELLPFMHDTRDAVPIGADVNRYLKIRDIAVNAAAEILGTSFPFRLRKLSSYTDQEVAEVKRLIAGDVTD